MHKIRLLPQGTGAPFRWHILLDDVDVSHFVSGALLDLRPNCPPLLTLELMGNVEIPTEFAGIVDAEKRVDIFAEVAERTKHDCR